MSDKENIIQNWSRRAAIQGVTLNRLAEVGGIDRSQFFRWRSDPPKAVKAFLLIEDFLEQLEKEQTELNEIQTKAE